MSVMRQGWLVMLLSMLALSVFAPTVAMSQARAPVIAALGTIEPGQWQLREREGARTLSTRNICVSDASSLLQVRHPGASCSRYVITNDPKNAVVHYTCPGAGHGRTNIRVETPRLIQIFSQGIADNAPFDFKMEGRRVGSCSAAGGTR